MKILALDPGTTKTAYVKFDTTNNMLSDFGIKENEKIKHVIEMCDGGTVMAIEKVESYGMAVGAEVFTTVFWAGRFAETYSQWFSNEPILIPRREVKLAICFSPRANDSNIRQAIIDMYGGKDTAIGKKKNPGKLYGVSKDVWAALGVAITASLKLKG